MFRKGDNMFFSIIIPAYNAEKTITKTLKSVVNQTYKNFEVLIIDDGSSDGTCNIVNRFIAKYGNFHYYKKKNGGVSSARNYGIVKCKGNYICFLDSDDLLCSDYLDEFNKKISEKNLDFCYCGYSIFNESGTYNVKTRFSNRNILYKYIGGKIKAQTSCFAIRKELIIQENIRFSEGISWGEDFEFFCKVMNKSSNCSFVKKRLFLYNDNCMLNKLSSFDIKKIDKDFLIINKVQNEVNLSCLEKKLLLYYKLPGTILYRLYDSFNYNVDDILIKEYYNKYNKYISFIKLVNGLRSIKLLLIKWKLYKKLRNYKII